MNVGYILVWYAALDLGAAVDHLHGKIARAHIQCITTACINKPIYIVLYITTQPLKSLVLLVHEDF